MFMTTDDAFEMVIELARSAVIQSKDCDSTEMRRERIKQIASCDTVEDFYVNSVAEE